MSVSRTVSEIFSIKEWRDLDTGGRGRSSSLKIVTFYRSHTTFYRSAIVCIALSCTIFESFYVEQAVWLGGRHNIPPPRDLDF